MKKIIVLVSGSGTNLQAIIDAIANGKIPETSIELVISNRKAAYGLERAKLAGIETLYFPLKPYTDDGLSREQYDSDLAERIKAYQPDLIVLAGWMHILSPALLTQFPNQVINLHPALPDQFPGTHAIERAYEAAQRGEAESSGCMVHYVIPEIDAGDVITQAIVPILPDDTLEAFETRMHDAEHQIIVEAVAKLLAGS